MDVEGNHQIILNQVKSQTSELKKVYCKVFERKWPELMLSEPDSERMLEQGLEA